MCAKAFCLLELSLLKPLLPTKYVSKWILESKQDWPMIVAGLIILSSPADIMRRPASNMSHSHSIKTMDESRLPIDLCPTVTLVPVFVITPGINLSSIGNSQAMQSTNNQLNDFLTPENPQRSWLPIMSVSTMSQL